MSSALYAEALNHKSLSKEREYELCSLYAALRKKLGAKHAKTLAARNQIVQSNIRLVAKMANRYKRLPLEDLISEGVTGLITAVERFDVTRGWRLGTYATYWIWHALQRANENLGDLVRVPVHRQTKLRHGAVKRAGVHIEGVAPVSLDASFSDDGEGGSLYDVLADDTESVLDTLLQQQTGAELWRVVCKVLDPREQEIIKRRYLSHDGQTLAEVGEHVGGISRERVRQLQDLALEKLRHELNRLAKRESARATKAVRK